MSMNSDVVISSDSHFVEPPSMWAERIEARFRDRAPHPVSDLPDREGEYLICENSNAMPVAQYYLAGVDPADYPEKVKIGIEGAPAHVWDPAARIAEQDRDGIAAEVIYTSMGLPLFGLDDLEFQAACFRAFNDWAADYCSQDPKRLVGVGLLPLGEVEWGVAELRRIAKKGLRGAMIWAEPPANHPYSHPDYDALWHAAEELDMPLSMHVLTSRKGTGVNFQEGNLVSQATVLYQEIERTLTSMVCEGVLERFPGLKIVSAENDIGWLPYFLFRMEKVYDKLRYSQQLDLTLRPKEYVQRQVYFTFIDDPFLGPAVEHLGPKNIMWSNDFPHAASSYPHSREAVAKACAEMSAEVRQLVTHDNVVELYKLA